MSDVKEMIEGLVVQSDLMELKKQATNIIKDLKKEGFDGEDIRQYLADEIELLVVYEFL